MDQLTSARPVGARGRDGIATAFSLLVIAALLLGLARRLLVGWNAPLWLDETFTAAIAMQPTFAGLVYDCLHELGGPVYYGFIWAWEKLAGPSDLSMRLPSLIFAVAAPLAILWRGHPDRTVRWTWAALAALWIPGAYYASEARSYSLLFLLGSIQLILFTRLLRDPGRGAATLWCIVSALLILTHYHAGVVAGLQGLAFVAVHRLAALRTWPAALVFVPVAGWMVLHLPLHIRFSDADVAWQTLLTFRDLVRLPQLLLGLGLIGYILILVVAASLAADAWTALRGRAAFPYAAVDLIAVTTSLAAVALVFGWGFVSESFTARYLIPFAPGVLLGLSLWSARVVRRWKLAPVLLVALFALSFARDMGAKLAVDFDFRRGYSWDRASAYLRSQGVEHLVFMWDNSNAIIMDPWQLGRVGAFFIHRAGDPVTHQAVKAIGSDAFLRGAMLKAANSPAARGKVTGTITLARFDHALELSRDDPSWTCKRFGGPPLGTDVFSTACWRAPVPTGSAEPAPSGAARFPK